MLTQRYRRWTPEDDKVLRELAARKLTYEQAGAEIGRSRNAVKHRSIILGLGFGGREHGRPRSACWERAKNLAESGIYLTEAARRLGIHWSTAIYISRKMGFAWPKAPLTPTAVVHRIVEKPLPPPAEDDFIQPVSARIELMLELAQRSA